MTFPRRQTFVSAWITTFLYNFAWGILFPLRYVYIHDQGIPLIAVGTLATAGSVGYSISSLTFGNLSDRIGKRKPLLIAALVICSVSYGLYQTTTSYAGFFALVVLDMSMIGAYSLMMNAIVTEILPKDSRGRVYGRYRVSGTLGYALAAGLIGVVTGRFGISAVFIIAALFVGLSGITALFLRESDTEPAQGHEKEIPAGKRPTFKTSLGTILATGFIWILIADLISTIGLQTASPFQNIYYQDVLRISEGQIGTLAMIAVLAEIPAMLLLTPLSDRVGRLPVILITYLVPAVVFLIIYFSSDYLGLIFAHSLLGLSIVRYTVGAALITDWFPRNLRGTILGAQAITFGVGGFIAPSLGGVLAEYSGIRLVFIVASALNFLAAGVFIISSKHNSQEQAHEQWV